jgi:hypothetical protein
MTMENEQRKNLHLTLGRVGLGTINSLKDLSNGLVNPSTYGKPIEHHYPRTL